MPNSKVELRFGSFNVLAFHPEKKELIEPLMIGNSDLKVYKKLCVYPIEVNTDAVFIPELGICSDLQGFDENIA